ATGLIDTGVPNALQGFSRNRAQPTKIQSASLEVREKAKVAAFSDHVRLTQGDTTLTCASLVIHYDREPSAALNSKARNSGGQQQIQQLEAKGGIIVKDKQETAMANRAIFDAKSNTWTLLDSVVVTRGNQVVRGERLVIDVATSVSQMDGGRIRALFLPE